MAQSVLPLSARLARLVNATVRSAERYLAQMAMRCFTPHIPVSTGLQAWIKSNILRFQTARIGHPHFAKLAAVQCPIQIPLVSFTSSPLDCWMTIPDIAVMQPISLSVQKPLGFALPIPPHNMRPGSIQHASIKAKQRDQIDDLHSRHH